MKKYLLLSTLFTLFFATHTSAQVTLLTTQPTNNATNVALDANIVLTFDSNINATNINANNIRVHGSQTGSISGGFSGGGSTMVTFNPTTNFKPGELITITVSSALITNPTVFSFTITVSPESAGVFVKGQNTISTLADAAASVYTADIDGDGDLDVLSASQLDDKIAWYANDGLGNFGPQQIITTIANGAFSVSAADLDGDGDMDVLSASWLDSKIAWYQNDGLGNFGPQRIIAQNAVLESRSVYATDLDGDGDLDVLSASLSDDKIGWYENDGSGNFSKLKIITLSANGARSVYAADIDGDGDMDVLSASQGDDKIAWYANNGTGTFGGQRIISTLANGARSLYAADLDGDGDMDVLSASQNDNKIAWYANDGLGNFGTQQIISVLANLAQSVYAADMDGDGDLDVLSASFVDNKIAWYENDGLGNFGVQQIVSSLAGGANSVYAADLDGDGDMDVLSASQGDDKIAWYENDFVPVSLIATSPSANATNAALTANIGLTFDGTINGVNLNSSDIYINGAQTGSLTFTISGIGSNRIIINPTKNFKPGELITVTINAVDIVNNPTVFSFNATVNPLSPGVLEGSNNIATTANGAQNVFSADIDGDGDLDALSASADDNKIAWYANDGLGNFGAQQNISVLANGASSVYAADINGDGDMDVISASANDNKIAWYDNDGLGNFGPQQTISILAEGASSVYATDIDGDGDMDVISASVNDNKIAWYANDGLGNFGPQQIISVLANGASSVYAADLDGDGDLDVLSASSTDNKIAWYANDGLSNFGSQQIISVLANGASSVYAADLDSDGDLDVLSASQNDNKIAWYANNGTGTFDPQQIISVLANGASSVYVADLDGDRDVDVISTSQGDDKIAWYENDGMGNFGVQQIVSSLAGGASSVYAADLDGDGDLDVLSASLNDNKIAWHENTLFPIVTTNPVANAINVATDANIVFSFEGVIKNSLAIANIKAHGSQTGIVIGNFSGGGTNEIVFNPTNNFKPGELISVSIPSTTTANQMTFSFTAAVSSTSPGEFVNGQNIISTLTDGAASVYAADMDGDGDIDVLSASQFDDKIAWYVNDGSGNFGIQQIISIQADGPKSVYAADIDGDSDLDVLSASEIDSRIAWYKNDGTGNFGPKQNISDNNPNFFAQNVFATDLDSDGDIDVLSAFNDGNIFLHINIGSGNFSQQQNLSNMADGAKSLYVADIDGDGDIDVLSASSDEGRIAWQENDGTGNFGTRQFINNTLALNANSVYAADIDGDGDMDVLSAIGFDNEIVWYANDGTGNFGPQQTITSSVSVGTSVYVTDMDGDGDMDVLSASLGDAKIAWYANDGLGNFGPQQIITNLAVGATSVYAADIDGDGDLDVLSASQFDDKIAWYENASTTLSLEDFSTENGFRLFPNPVQNLLNISINNGLLIETYEIYNINGQAVGKGTNLPQEGIDVSNLASGIYILKLQTDKGTRSEKFIKI